MCVSVRDVRAHVATSNLALCSDQEKRIISANAHVDRMAKAGREIGANEFLGFVQQVVNERAEMVTGATNNLADFFELA